MSSRRRAALGAEDDAWSASLDVSWVDAPGELMLFDAAADTYHALNPAAAAVWRLMVGGATIDAATTQLAARHGVANEQMRADVGACVTDLATRGLLVRRAP